jgi:uncharacterized repeat protein (TIGR01451 family)
MKRSKKWYPNDTNTAALRRLLAGAFPIAALVCSAVASAATVRDNFSTNLYSNNDGTANWSTNWIENDVQGAGPTSGNVLIVAGNLELDDQPNTNTEPGLAREANLLGATSATLKFDWSTTSGVDNNDSIIVEVSANGGSSWTTLENFTGINGSASGSRSYDITAYVAANTRIRFRVNNLYGGGNEKFRVDYVEIDYAVILSGTDLMLTQSDTPDPVNVVNPLSYSLTVINNGPDDATGVTVTDLIPAGTTFQSASATQGSCSESVGTVTCALGNMLATGSATINIALTAPFTTGSISNSATVSASETDPIPTNNASSEDTTVQNLNVNQLCYLVADGNNIFTRIDTADFNPATNETTIGGTGVGNIEAIAYNSASGVVYAANANRLGTLNTTTGAFQGLPQTFGTGSGSAGNITFSDVDGLTYDSTIGVLFGSHARGGNDLLIQIDMTTGAHVPNAFGPNVDYVEIQPVAGLTIVDDIAVDPTTGIMYAAVNNGGTTDRLATINKSTGATTSISLITVPDIEGLGTDPSGQLWGTSGTQGILYEISKTTGVGSNGRTINNGSDYESVDCYAVSPTISADLALTKIVDDAGPREGDTVNYTVTVTNTGPGPATVVQVMDLLPAGVTFVSALPGQGTYDSISGDWFVGNLPAGSSVNLMLEAEVDAGTGGSTITNTASIDFLSQVDVNSANDVATVNIVPVGSPSLLVVKTSMVIDDPINNGTNPKAIPGGTVRYLIGTTNSGTGGADTDTVVVTDAIPASTALRVSDFDGLTNGPVQFVDGTPNSGLTYAFASLADPSDDVSFSNDGGVTFSYAPVAIANGTDPAVTHIRVNPKGLFVGDTGAGAPNFQIFFKAVIQ